MDKSPEAFRTISEVAEALETPAHVLRFWESRFPQIRPVKRAGGRRYYRPSDVALLTGIKRLLHDEGMTIRGVQKILREHGVRHVSGLSEEASAEEEALGAAMAGRLDDEPGVTPAEAADATAAALRAALAASSAPQVAAILPFRPMAPPQPALPGLEPEAEAGALIEPVADAADHPADADDSPPPDLAQTDLAQTDPGQTDLADSADPPPPPAPETMPEAMPEAIPESAPESPPESAAGVAPPAPAEEPLSTLAARLRALPRGSLAARRLDLAALRARIGALRARLSAPHAGS